MDRLGKELIELDRRHHDTRIEMILSDPCFEFWLLLHFGVTDRPFLSSGGGRTACDSVIEVLRGHLPEYKKNAPDVFGQFKEHADYAVVNAKRLEALRSELTENSPSTDVVKLVRRLLEIAQL